jgi:probable FeS assembly SUF system protein SufT
VQERIILSRDVDAVQIPSGEAIALSIGTEVFITQTLGGSYTVATSNGLARISSADADALGIEPKAETEKPDADAPAAEGTLEEQVWEQLKHVYDPEIPVDIVNLGLVYDCKVVEEGEQTVARVKMTLTAPGCGMGPVIAADAQSRIMAIAGIDDAHVDLVWEPAWNMDMLSEEARMKLGLV